ncbi:hypothetical protein ADT25_19545 [Xanthomonas oryzae]|uniref:Uncharacterized protein n=1 Tax=Xanthomonas oryzae TaxID=347 RepID=A0AAP0ZIB0_9XANT|nr:hypothetical protein ADT25_19545 [Xanthomonas oryzae]QBG84870.1 helix-turn-helix domain-containing protein [Xanthomonas oryzae]
MDGHRQAPRKQFTQLRQAPSKCRNGLDIAMHRLRRKLHGSGVGIRTIRGLGYLLQQDQDGDDEGAADPGAARPAPTPAAVPCGADAGGVLAIDAAVTYRMALADGPVDIAPHAPGHSSGRGHADTECITGWVPP